MSYYTVTYSCPECSTNHENWIFGNSIDNPTHICNKCGFIFDVEGNISIINLNSSMSEATSNCKI